MQTVTSEANINKYTDKEISLEDVDSYTKNIVGKMKTLIDATISEPRQNKAVKDMIHNLIWEDSFGDISKWVYRSDEIRKLEHSNPDGRGRYIGNWSHWGN